MELSAANYRIDIDSTSHSFEGQTLNDEKRHRPERESEDRVCQQRRHIYELVEF